MSQPPSASRRTNKTPTRLEDQVYSLVQFVDDGILAICTPKNIRTRDDGRKEAQYGDDYYLCTVMFESDDKEDVMKRKNGLEKLTAQGKSTQTAQKKKGPRKSAEGEAKKKEEREKEKGKIESIQAQNEKEREKAAKKAEKEKKKAEIEKKKAENAKKKAENEKKKLEKEKQKAEKEKEKAEKERERAALKERDNRVLMQMNLLASSISPQDDFVSDSENEDPNIEYNNLADNFNDEDLVSRCTNILQVPSGSHVGGKGPTNCSGPKDTPSFSFGGLIQGEGEPMTQPAFTDHTHKSQPPRPSFGSKRPRVNNLYTNRSDMQGLEAMTQPTLTDHTHKNQPPRPSFGGKRPRINNLYTNQSDIQGHEPLSQLMITGHTHNKQHTRPSFGGKRPRLNNRQSETPASNCYKCEEHLATIRRQQEEIAQLRAQVNGRYEDLPRPGKVPQIVAERFKMVELSTGRGVFLYEDHLSTAKSKSSPTSAACFLLSCFYKNSELVGRNLTGANARESINPDILASILDFAVKEGGKLAGIKSALRNKISSITTRASGWRPSRGLQDSSSSGIYESD